MALNFQDRKIEDNFEKLSFTEAKCKKCINSTFIHTSFDKFCTHIIETHSDIVEKEKLLQSNLSLKYIRCNRERPGYQCALCKENVEIESEDCTHHIHEGDEYASLRNNYEKWQFKYCEMQQENDSEIKCYICQNGIKIDFRRDNLMYHIREYHSEHPPQNVKDIAALTLSDEIWQNFKNFSNVEAECKTCNWRIAHTYIPQLEAHIKGKHKEVIEFEKVTELKPSQKYIKYCKNKELQCVLCEDQIMDKNDYVNHIHANDEFTSMGKHYERWELKYYKRRTISYIQCNICKGDLRVALSQKRLITHIEECQKKISSKKKDRYWLLLHYVQLSQYYNRVECKYCNHKTKYIDTSELLTHLMIHHKHTFNFQKQNSPKKSCRNLKYFNKKYYRCDICHEAVSSAALLVHECKDDYNDTMIIDDEWLWKYFVQINDFVVKCALCLDTYDINLFIGDLKSHFNNDCPKIKQMTYGIEFHKDTTTLNTAEVWQYFEKNEKKSLSKARCTLCTHSEKLFNYVHTTLFSKHIEEHHPEIFQFETQELLSKYVKYMYGVCMNFYHCVVCDIDIILDKGQLNDHIHKDKKLNHYLYYDDWSWKYCTKVNDSSVKCERCLEKISIEYDTSLLENHLRTNHKINPKRTYKDIADPKAGKSGTPPKQQKLE